MEVDLRESERHIFANRLIFQRRFIVHRLVVLIVALTTPLCLLAVDAAAQSDDSEAPSSSVQESANGEVTEVNPAIHYHDREGELVPVAEISYEELIELYKLREKLAKPDQPPRFRLDHIEIDGQVSGDRAALEVQVAIFTQAEGWVRAPLAMPNLVLRQPAEYAGPAERQFLAFEPSEGGYVAWIFASGEEQKHTFTLNAAATIEEQAGRHRLAFHVSSTTIGELRLKVEKPAADPSVTGGAELLPPAQGAADPKTINVGFRGGDVQVSWRDAQTQVQAAPAVLEASGVITVRVEQRRHIVSDALLTVRSHSRPVDQFTVRLPPGMSFVPRTQSAMRVSPVNSRPDSDDIAAGLLVNVQLNRPTLGPVEVRLRAESRAEDAWQPIAEPASFEVIDAIKQGGHIAIVVLGDWTAHWTEGSHVRRVDELPSSINADNPTAGFEYYRQPCELKVQVLPKKTRVTVEPTYVLYIGRNRAQLEARLRYNVRGVKADFVDLNISGWELDDVAPGRLVNIAAIDMERLSPLVIPLTESAEGEFELTLTAHRIFDPEQNRMLLELPHANSSSTPTATVVVVADDDVALAPLQELMANLTPVAVPAGLSLPERRSSALAYRSAGQALFACDVEERQGMMTVQAEGEINLAQSAAVVRQAFDYQIAYEPVDTLMLDVPDPQGTWAGMTIKVNGEETSYDLLQDNTAVVKGRRLAQVQLKAPVEGECLLETEYVWPLPVDQQNKSLPASIPLSNPVENGRLQSSSSTLRINSSDDLQVVMQDTQPWRPAAVEANPASEPNEQTVQASGVPNEVRLLLVQQAPSEPELTTLSKAWVQTWLSQDKRRDRAVFRFTTSERRARVLLPVNVTAENVLEVLLDGVVQEEATMLPGAQRGRRTLDIQLGAPDDATSVEEHTLELTYLLDRSSRDLLSLYLQSIELPELEGALGAERMYWQLVLPSEEHVLTEPEGMTLEADWQWQGFFFSRKAFWSQSDLARWVGVAPGTPLPTAANSLVFSSFGSTPEVHIRTSVRRVTVLAASGATLLIGLLLIYVPWLGRRATLAGVAFAASVVIIAMGLWEPRYALATAQASSLGVALAALAHLLARSARRETATRPVRPVAEAPSIRRASHSSSRMTTATAPIANP